MADFVAELIAEGECLLEDLLQEQRSRHPRRSATKKMRRRSVRGAKHFRKSHSSIIARPQYRAGSRGY